MLGCATCFHRGIAHGEGELAATGQVSVCDIVFIQFVAVEGGIGNVDVPHVVAFGLDGELVAVLHGDSGLAEHRASDNILVSAGCNGIDAEGAEDIP